VASAVAVSPDGKFVYVAENYGNRVSVIDTFTNEVTDTITVGDSPSGVAFSPDGKYVYVTNNGDMKVVAAGGEKNYPSTVSVIDTATNTVTATIPGFNVASGVAFSLDGNSVYVTNSGGTTVSVIGTPAGGAGGDGGNGAIFGRGGNGGNGGDAG
jgi:YVTN family beta-propeller protein